LPRGSKLEQSDTNVTKPLGPFATANQSVVPNESPNLMSEPQSGVAKNWDYTGAFLVLRAWLGVRSVVAGLEKYAGTRVSQQPMLDADGQPDMSGAMIEVKEKAYSLDFYQALPESLRTQFAGEPLMPSFLTTPFYAALGPVLILLGVLLLLGVCTRWTLIAMGLLYTSLTVGLILIKQDPGVAWLAIHVGLIAGALVLRQHNRFSLTRS
jgi:thiosulfate dehydrogenase (quinone) large subunit